MKLSGSFTVSSSRDRVYAFLTNPRKVVDALPDIQSSEVEEDAFTVEARVGVGPMRGTMRVHLKMVVQEPNEHATYRGQSKGMGTTVDLETTFALRDAENGGGGTSVDWSGDARIVGRLASVAGGMLDPLARKNIQTFVNAVQGSLEQEERS